MYHVISGSLQNILPVLVYLSYLFGADAVLAVRGPADFNSQCSSPFSLSVLMRCLLCRGLRKDLFGRYKKKEHSRSRSRSKERRGDDKGRGRWAVNTTPQ